MNFKLNDKQRYALVGAAIVLMLIQLVQHVSDLYHLVSKLFDETTIEV